MVKDNFLHLTIYSRARFSILVILIFFLAVGLLTFNLALAQTTPLASSVNFQPQIGIPNSQFQAGGKVAVTGYTIASYINAFYVWAIRAVAILAIFIIMLAGFRWLTAAGNATAIGRAKNQMIDAFIGLILILCANLMLYLINPALVRFKDLSKQITTIQPINIDINQMDLELFLLLPHQISHNIEQLYNRYSQSKRPNAGKDTFCLYEDNNTPKNSGQGWAIGGPRGLTAFLVYPDNVRRENVAIKGRWWFEDDPAHPFSLCSNTNSDLAKDGCGDGQDGWSINIHSDMDYAWCSGDSLCAGVSATKADVFHWEGQRGVLGSPGLSSQHKGEFVVEVTMFSRKNEFPPITEREFFGQTCGIGVEDDCRGSGTKYCCKIPYPSTEDPDFYYDFRCSLALPCDQRYTPGEQDPHKKAVTQPDMQNIYCNI